MENMTECFNGKEMGETLYEGQGNVHDDPWSSQPSVVNEDLVCADEDSREQTIHHFITFPAIFHKFHGSLHEIVSEKLAFQKLCSDWVPKMLTDEHKVKQQATALIFLTVSKAMNS
jgi:hypothetical protein